MAKQAPDVIVYVPGLFQNGPDQSVEMVAARVAHAADLSSEPRFTYTAKAAEDFPYADQKARKSAVIRSEDGAEDVHVYDVYTFDYIDTLIAGADKRNPFVQALSVFWVIVRHSPRMLLSLFSKGKTLREKAQVVYAAILYVLLFGYMLSLLYVALNGLFDALHLAGYATPKFMQTDVSNLFEGFIVVLTSLGLWSKKDTKAILDRVAVETTAVAKYLHDGTRARSAHGRLEDLIDEIAGRGGYRNLHIVGYSFGSIIAVDTLYPRGSEPGYAMREVATLVSIGCPFDFIRTFWPAYFDSRTVVEGVPYAWVNIFDPNDVLGSNFADSVKGVDQPRGVRSTSTAQYLPKNVEYDVKRDAARGFLAWVQLAGFRAHGHYWERGDVFDKNSYRIIIRELRGRPQEPAAAGEAAG